MHRFCDPFYDHYSCDSWNGKNNDSHNDHILNDQPFHEYASCSTKKLQILNSEGNSFWQSDYKLKYGKIYSKLQIQLCYGQSENYQAF